VKEARLKLQVWCKSRTGLMLQSEAARRWRMTDDVLSGNTAKKRQGNDKSGRMHLHRHHANSEGGGGFTNIELTVLNAVRRTKGVNASCTRNTTIKKNTASPPTPQAFLI